MKTDTVTVKLSTGEEVLGKYVGDEKDSISISKPVVLTPTPQGQIALTPSPTQSRQFAK